MQLTVSAIIRSFSGEVKSDVTAKPARSQASTTPIAFLHGLGGSKNDWDEMLKHFPAKNRALTLDLPSIRRAASGLDPHALAEWVLQELRKNGAAFFHLVGHSLGGRVAGEIAALQPRSVSSISLIGPLGVMSYGLTDRLKWKAMSRAAVLKSVPEDQMKRALGYGFTREGPAKAAFVARAMTARTGKNSSEALESLEKCVDGILQAPPLVKRLEKSAVPGFLIVGSDDPLCPPGDVWKLQRVMSRSQIFELPGSGHYPMIEEPRKTAELVSSFVTAAEHG